MANMAAGLNRELYAGASRRDRRHQSAVTAAPTPNQSAQQAKIKSDIQAAGGLNTTARASRSRRERLHQAKHRRHAADGDRADKINAQMEKFTEAWDIRRSKSASCSPPSA